MSLKRHELEKERLKKIPYVFKNELKLSGVLLSDKIKECADKFKLIEPLKESNLKPAAYELTIGDRYSIEGKIESLTAENDKIIIEPFQVAIIKTEETLNLPAFLIARWNIRVKWAYEGLLWVGGPQVDPGYVGHLFCPIYNLSKKPVTLKMGEEIAVIDFITTTKFVKSKSKKYEHRPPKRLIIDDYNPQNLESALFADVGKRLINYENQIKEIETTTDTRLTRTERIFYTVIASFISALAIIIPIITILFVNIVESGETDGYIKPIFIYLMFIVSILFSLVSIVVSFIRLKKQKKL